MSAQHIRQAFLNVNMGNRFQGLCEIAQKGGVDVKRLSPGSCLVFVNRKRDKIAMLVGAQIKGQKQTMAYEVMPVGHSIDLRAIRELPHAFNGTTIDVNKATLLAIDKALANRKSKIIEAAL